MNYRLKNTSQTAAEVELAGWIENGVCLESGRPGMGQRGNRFLREVGISILHGTAESFPAKEPAVQRPDILLEDFENGYGKWKVDGEAFGEAPASGTLEGQQHVSGFQGKGLVNTFLRGDRTTGVLTSEPFRLERRYVAFLIGGGSDKENTRIALVVDGAVVRAASALNEERLRWDHWDVSEFAGREARIQIVDRATGGWGHINLDHILLTDAPPRGPSEA